MRKEVGFDIVLYNLTCRTRENLIGNGFFYATIHSARI